MLSGNLATFVIMNTFQYDPISPVQVSPVLQSGANTNYSYPSLSDLKSVNQFYDTSGFNSSGDSESFSNGGAAIAGTVGSLLASVLNYYQQKKLLDIQQNYQKDFFDYTFGKQTSEKWKEIEYNTPFRQLQRYLDAGLNANLLYGSLGNVGASSGNAPANAPSGLSGQMPNVAPFFDFASPIQALLSPLTAMSQIDLNKSQSYKNYKSAGLDEAEANRRSLLTPYEIEQYQANISKIIDEDSFIINQVESQNIDNWIKETLKGELLRERELQIGIVKSQYLQEKNAADISKVNLKKAKYEFEEIMPLLKKEKQMSINEIAAVINEYNELTPERKKNLAKQTEMTQMQLDNFFGTQYIMPAIKDATQLGGDLATKKVRKM